MKIGKTRGKRTLVNKPMPIPDEESDDDNSEVVWGKPSKVKSNLISGRVKMPNGRNVVVWDSEFSLLVKNVAEFDSDSDRDSLFSKVASGDESFLEVVSAVEQDGGYTVRFRIK